MKKKIIIGFLAPLCYSAKSQILSPVKWSYAAKKTSSTDAIIYIKANIEKGWHVYSQFVSEGGPVKTTFHFPISKNYLVIAKTLETNPVTKYESTFKMNVSYFEDQVIFQQKVRLKAESPSVKGSIEFMVCNDKQCLPPDQVNFSIPVK